MKPNSEVLTTSNYELFKTIKGNRSLNPNHLVRLAKSIKINGQLNPILTNSKYEIIDGQHRAAVCKSLGIPINYIKGNGLGLNEVQVLNSIGKNWSGTDHAESRAFTGNENYQIFIDFRNKYGFGQYESILLLNRGNADNKSNHGFRAGTFVAKDLGWGNISADKIYQVKKYYSGFKRRSFVLAMITLFKNKDYDHNVFVHKLAFNSQKLVDCTDTEQYIKLIETIYNYRNGDKRRFI